MHFINYYFHINTVSLPTPLESGNFFIIRNHVNHPLAIFQGRCPVLPVPFNHLETNEVAKRVLGEGGGHNRTLRHVRTPLYRPRGIISGFEIVLRCVILPPFPPMWATSIATTQPGVTNAQTATATGWWNGRPN